MRRDHRVPPESANRRLSSTSRIARTTEARATASPEKARWGLTRAAASQKEIQSISPEYIASSRLRRGRQGAGRGGRSAPRGVMGRSASARRPSSRPRLGARRGGAGPARTPRAPDAWAGGERGAVRRPAGRRRVTAARVPRPGSRAPGAMGGRAPTWASVVVRARRCVRIWSITDVWVMTAMIRMGPWHVGQASGSTSKELLQEGRPPAGRFRGCQPWGGHDHRRPLRRSRLGPAARAARPVGIPAIVPRRHVALIRDVDQHPREELQRVGGFGVGRGTLRLVGAIGHGLRGPVILQALERDRIPGAVPREPGREGAIVLRDPDGGVHVSFHPSRAACGGNSRSRTF